MATGERSMKNRPATGARRLAGLLLLGASTLSPAHAGVPPGRAVVLDSFADPFALGHSGALLEADPLAGPDGNVTPLSSSPLLYEAQDLAFLPDGRMVVADRDADPSGLGEDPNLGNGHGAIFVAAAEDAGISLLADGSNYPAGRPAGWASIFVDPQGLAVDLDGSILVADRDSDPSELGLDLSGFSGQGALFRVDPATGVVTLVSDGSLSVDGASPDGSSSWFEDPGDVAVSSDGRIFLLETFADPAGLGGSGAIFEITPGTGELRLAAVSALFDAPLGLTARPDGLLAVSDQLADPTGDGSRGAVFLIDPDAPTPEAAVIGLLTDPRFRSLARIDAAPDSSLFLADAFADPLSLGHLGAVWRIPVGSPIAIVSTDSPYRALASVAVSPPTEPAPTVSSITPALASQEDLLTVTLGGTGFLAPGEVELGDGVTVNAVRVLSGTVAEADVSVDPAAGLGPRDVRFINADWQAGRLDAAFEIVSAPRPIVITVSPVTAVQSEALTATVTGANFLDPVTADFGPGVSVLAVRVLDPGNIEVDLQVDPAATPGFRSVTITNPDLRSGTLVDAFEVVEPAPPELVLVEPFLLARGESVDVELTGSNFSDGMEASFGPGITVGKVEVLSSGRALCRLHVRPNADNGPRDGSVTNPDTRSGSLIDAVVVSQAPVVRVVGLRLADSLEGDGEGDLDPGETVGLDFELHGPGTTLAGSVVLRITNPAPGLGLSVLRAAVPFPDVAPGANVRRPAAPYPEVSLSADAICGDSHPLIVEVEANGVRVSRQEIQLPVGRVSTWRRKPVSDGTESGGRRGQAVALADLDGDGIADLIVGAPREDGGDVFDSGRVLATSGATDDPLWTLDGDEINGRLGSALAAVGDIDGDGLDDLLVGAPGEAGGAGRALLVSGLDGSIMDFVEGAPGDGLGAAVSLAGDRDLDGRRELAVAAPAAAGGDGFVVLLAASDLRELSRLQGSGSERLGTALALLGDADDDGRDDLAIGAPDSGSGAGALVIWRGDGSLSRVPGDAPGEGFGSALAAGIDADADGSPDILVGAPGAAAGTGRAAFVDGASGATLVEFTGDAPGDEFGAAVALLPDLDGDGVAEVALGSPGALSEDGRLEILAGGTGTLLFLREGTTGSAGRLGQSLAAGRDAGGDAFRRSPDARRPSRPTSPARPSCPASPTPSSPTRVSPGRVRSTTARTRT